MPFAMKYEIALTVSQVELEYHISSDIIGRQVTAAEFEPTVSPEACLQGRQLMQALLVQEHRDAVCSLWW